MGRALLEVMYRVVEEEWMPFSKVCEKEDVNESNDDES